MSRIRLSSTLTTVAVLAMIAAGAVGAGTGHGPQPLQRWSKSDRSAANFMVAIVRQKIGDQNELAWQQLYPLHQAVAPLGIFIACQSSIPFPGTLLQVRALRVVTENTPVAGVATSLSSKAITLRVKVRVDFSPRPLVVLTTLHAVPVRGHWAWILSAAQYGAYSAGECP